MKGRRRKSWRHDSPLWFTFQYPSIPSSSSLPSSLASRVHKTRDPFFQAARWVPTWVLIYLTFDQHDPPWGKMEQGSWQVLWVRLVYPFTISDERLHCLFHFGSLFLISYSNTWQLRSLTCSAEFLIDKSDLFMFSNFVRYTLKLDETGFSFWLGHRNSLENFIVIHWRLFEMSSTRKYKGNLPHPISSIQKYS